ncbi:MAG: serine O-acetyltransferase [Cyanothece sp. SIO1E1]|nr:serine O-acetyltransferase [Cyanothece sp. SIO1E1]
MLRSTNPFSTFQDVAWSKKQLPPPVGPSASAQCAAEGRSPTTTLAASKTEYGPAQAATPSARWNRCWRWPVFDQLGQHLRKHPLLEDLGIIFERDPAARNWLEVLCCYPGLHALVCHRLAHRLHQGNVPFFPRLISHITRFLTGIEIHPGAQLGKGVVIDHGMGVVIGETAIVGNYTLIYQGVTLGGTGKEMGKRHPTIGDHVVVGAGAKVLGNIQIGDYARIGAGSIVLRDVPTNCTAVGVPGRNICRSNTQTCPLEHSQIPDAEATVMRTLIKRIEQLEQALNHLKKDINSERDAQNIAADQEPESSMMLDP